MQEVILEALRTLEAETGCRVLHACESGSRAWGFASRDSDWDVRFVFAWPRDAYLRVQLPASTLTRQLPGDLDVSGWDLRMALSHFAKSNASFLEWLGSPMVYRQDADFREALERLRAGHFQPRAAMDHYLGLAKSLWRSGGEDGPINGKRCLYVLRAVLAAQWALEKGFQPPVPFVELLAPADAAGLRGEIDALLAAKGAGSETDAFPVSGDLRGFVAERRTALEAAAQTMQGRPADTGDLDRLFRATLERLAAEGTGQ